VFYVIYHIDIKIAALRRPHPGFICSRHFATTPSSQIQKKKGKTLKFPPIGPIDDPTAADCALSNKIDNSTPSLN
jgi:hypothetical protein